MTKLGKALMVGMQVSSPGVVVANTRTVGASLCVWIASGLISWTCASSFAELGSAIPQNGGAQAYLAYAYCPLLAYLFAWTAIIALRPGGNAVISLIFAEYLNRIFWHSTRDNISLDGIPAWAIKLTACIAVSLVIALCVCDRKLGAPAAVVFSNVKVFIIVLGIVQLAQGKASPSLGEPWLKGSSAGPSGSNYVAGEMHQPGKNIPRAIHSSMVIVIVLFLLANVSYFAVLDKNLVGLSNTVAMDFGRAIFGPSGGTVFGFMVAFSCFDALNSGFFTASRLIYVAGCEKYLPALFGFRSLVNFSVVASWSFYFLTVFGPVILHINRCTVKDRYLDGRPGGWAYKGFNTRRVKLVWMIREFSKYPTFCIVLHICNGALLSYGAVWP
ncbi:APC amino acid permease [Lentinula edodes]|nr:APC amino acid permease [Lentinula edodes]